MDNIKQRIILALEEEFNIEIDETKIDVDSTIEYLASYIRALSK